ncbi:PAS domain S-box protein [Candidatus Woesearchaeota archaeon]|nr:MAG: PAS domain S-box protein [Candidatus Woesearchaeota archaeon]
MPGKKQRPAKKRGAQKQKRISNTQSEPSDELYQELLQAYKNASPAAMFILDKYTFTDINREALSLFSCAKDDILGKHPWDISPPKQPDGTSSLRKAKAHIDAALSGKPQMFEWVHRRKDGTDFTALVRLRRAKISGKVKVFASVQDLSDIVRTREELRILWSAVRNSKLSFLITDADEKIIYANPFASKLTGYSKSEILGSTPRIFKSGLTPRETYEEMWSTLRKGRSWHGVFINRKKSGKLFYEDAVIIPVLSKEGTLTHYVALKQDITPRILLQKKIEKNQKLLESYLELIPLMVVVLDRKGKIRFLNKAGGEILKANPAECIGKDWFSLFIPKNERAELKRYFKQLLSQSGADHDRVLSHENPVLTTTGEKRMIRWNNRLWFDEGELKRIIAVGEDITGKKRAEEELRKRYEELEVFKKVSVERELKMISLEKEIEKLRKKLSRKGRR